MTHTRDYIFTYDPKTFQYTGITRDLTHKHATIKAPEFRSGCITCWEPNHEFWYYIEYENFYTRMSFSEAVKAYDSEAVAHIGTVHMIVKELSEKISAANLHHISHKQKFLIERIERIDAKLFNLNEHISDTFITIDSRIKSLQDKLNCVARNVIRTQQRVYDYRPLWKRLSDRIASILKELWRKKE